VAGDAAMKRVRSKQKASWTQPAPKMVRVSRVERKPADTVDIGTLAQDASNHHKVHAAVYRLSEGALGGGMPTDTIGGGGAQIAHVPQITGTTFSNTTGSFSHTVISKLQELAAFSNPQSWSHGNTVQSKDIHRQTMPWFSKYSWLLALRTPVPGKEHPCMLSQYNKCAAQLLEPINGKPTIVPVAYDIQTQQPSDRPIHTCLVCKAALAMQWQIESASLGAREQIYNKSMWFQCFRVTVAPESVSDPEVVFRPDEVFIAPYFVSNGFVEEHGGVAPQPIVMRNGFKVVQDGAVKRLLPPDWEVGPRTIRHCGDSPKIGNHF
jgi:hypothetical protein